MGYWEEKREYEERLAEAEFCSVCGRKLTKENVKGMCVECKNIICNKCGSLKKGKIICSDCIEDIKEREYKEKHKDKRKWNTFSICGFFLSFLFFPLGLIFSIIAINQTKTEEQKGRGLAIAGLIISIFYLFIFLFLLKFTRFF